MPDFLPRKVPADLNEVGYTTLAGDQRTLHAKGGRIVPQTAEDVGVLDGYGFREADAAKAPRKSKSKAKAKTAAAAPARPAVAPVGEVTTETKGPASSSGEKE